MDERSTLQFRSNIYPTSIKGRLINDRKFLASISDPEALAILWRYNGSHGAYLNRLQRKQHDAAKHCAYAEDGDFPWGTPVGSDRVVCFCEKTDCPRFGECTDPQSITDDCKSLRGDNTGSQEIRPNRASQKQRIVSTRVNSSSDKGGKKVGVVFTRGWSDDERRRLRGAYFRCSREAIYKMFPHRSASDIDQQIELMGLATLPRPRRPKGRPKTGRSDRTIQPGASRKSSAQQPAKKKRGKVKKAPKPWTVGEDVIIRSNYPHFGSDVARWKKPLDGRDKAEIEKRAERLGLRHKPYRKRP